METIYQLLPKRLQDLQDSRKLTHEAAAEMCELPLRTYQAILYGDRFPREPQLIKLCTGFGVGMDYFFSSGGGIVNTEHPLEECARRLYEHMRAPTNADLEAAKAKAAAVLTDDPKTRSKA